MKTLTIPLFVAFATALGISLTAQLQDPQSKHQTSKRLGATGVILDIPNNLPESFTVSIPFADSALTLQLQKNSVLGKNTRFLVDNGSGELQKIDNISYSSYIGNVLNQPHYTINAFLTQKGLIASIIRPGEGVIQIEPSLYNANEYSIFVDNEQNRHLEQIDSSPTLEYTHDSPPSATDASFEIAASNGLITVGTQKAPKGRRVKSSATLRPSRKMDVLEYEIGVEIGSKAFFSKSAYNGNIEKAQAAAMSIVSNLDFRYLHAAGIKHRLGTVIIRTNPATDPLRNKVNFTGSSQKAKDSLAAFANYWNKHPNKVGNTHDLAVYHVKSSPSGLAYMNSVGTNKCYATLGSNTAMKWTNATISHELGHSWGLSHTSAPRNISTKIDHVALHLHVRVVGIHIILA